MSFRTSSNRRAKIVWRAIAAIIDRALRIHPHERWATAQEMLDAKLVLPEPPVPEAEEMGGRQPRAAQIVDRDRRHARPGRLVDQHESGALDHSGPLWSLMMFDAFLRRAQGEVSEAAAA